MATGKTMRAAVFRRVGRIQLTRRPIPTPGPGQVLLRVAACGVCGTDHHIVTGELTDGVQAPVVLGHEIAARVQRLGAGVVGLKPGQFCAVDPVLGCGVCEMCHTGRPNLCANPTVIGYKLHGGFAQYLLAPAGKVIPMDESVGPAGGVLCETLACVIHGYDRLGLRAGSSAMVLGAGTVGLLWTALLARSPVRRLIQTEIVDFRRCKALGMGADVVLDPQASDFQRVVRGQLPEGVDCIIDATGDPAAIQQALPLLARGGTMLIFGICPVGSSVAVDPFQLYNTEARIIASKMPPATLARSARLIEAGVIPIDQIVTALLPLSQLPTAVKSFNSWRDRQVKVAIDPWA
ncbi:MAG: alcohol dehydrogenase catalytic domain-containing protein [Phycisphaerae bacterium]|nr:alcohol dehydrogenase catalytic domain-containing protein [Phycisphaerae bacterium]